MKYLRLTDNDMRLGPITIGERDSRNRPLSIGIRSGDEEHPGCSLMLRGFGWPVRIALPQIIRPWREWHVVKNPDAYWEARGGGYWNVWPREYDIYVNEGALHLHYGPQTHDSITTKSKCILLPWKQWRYVGMRWYDLEGNLCESLSQKEEHAGRGLMDWYERRQAIEARVPKAVFLFKDFDGQEIRATTMIQEREHHFGDRWCSWLSVFRRPRIWRTLDIDFSKEVGREKGSWKGGTMGHSIEMLPGELHEAAFRRYCALGMSSKYGPSPMTFIGTV